VTRGQIIILILSACLISTPVKAWAQSPDPLSFSFQHDGNSYSFDGCFDTAVDPQTVWEVLTDYNHQSRFISNTHSRVRKREENDLLVEQTVGGGFLFIREEIKEMLLIHEEPLQAISVEDVSHKDFNLYQGVWLLSPKGDELEVTYILRAEKNRSTPKFVTPDLFRKSLRDLMREMKKEMDRREAKRQSPIKISQKTDSPGAR
jgi:hypothetical protein